MSEEKKDSEVYIDIFTNLGPEEKKGVMDVLSASFLKQYGITISEKSLNQIVFWIQDEKDEREGGKIVSVALLNFNTSVVHLLKEYGLAEKQEKNEEKKEKEQKIRYIAFINSVATDESCRRQGYSAKIFETIFQFCRHQGIYECFLECANDPLMPSYRLYTKLGFRKMTKDGIMVKGLNQVLMYLKLTSDDNTSDKEK
jgi:GNAT superfamily N-acetyltransferase